MMKFLRVMWIIAIMGIAAIRSHGLSGITFTNSQSDEEQYLVGELIGETNRMVIISHELMGTVMISNALIVEIVTNIADEDEETGVDPYGDGRIIGTVSWDNSLTAGISITKSGDFLMDYSGALKISRNRLWIDEWTFNASIDRRHDDAEVTYEKIEASLRYGHSFKVKWYGYVMLSASRNLELLLDYELLPTLGLGYWINDTDVFKLMGEIGGGYQYSVYTDPSVDDNVVLEGRTYMEWVITDDLTFYEDFQIIPAVNFDSFTLYNDTKFSVAVMENLNLNIVYELDYNSAPTDGATKAEHGFSTEIEWAF